MSLAPLSNHGKITIASLREQKLGREPITCLTAYDYATARLVDEAGIDMVLVGDSLAQTMLGYEDTLSITMEEMLHHVKAVRRGVKNAQPRIAGVNHYQLWARKQLKHVESRFPREQSQTPPRRVSASPSLDPARSLAPLG